MKAGLIFVLALMLVATSSVQADDDPETPWLIEEHCVPAPTQPPADWTFEGTIIATGWAGIHGMNAAWDTPHVLAFRDGWIDRGGWGTLSPDGRWYAVPQARWISGLGSGGYVDVFQLLIYDLQERQSVLRLEWDSSYQYAFGSGITELQYSRSPIWFDENTIVYQRDGTYYFVHVSDLTSEVWPEPSEWVDISPVRIGVDYPSPDWSRIVSINYSGLLDVETNQLIDYIDVTATAGGFPSIAWHPASTEFMASGLLSTTLYDVDGNIIEVISTASEDGFNNYTRVSENAYSADGTMFWLRLIPEVPGSWTMGLAIRADRAILDTCVEISSSTSVQLSPDGRYIALLGRSGQQELKIFDIENWRLYSTGIYHNGAIIGWRED